MNEFTEKHLKLLVLCEIKDGNVKGTASEAAGVCVTSAMNEFIETHLKLRGPMRDPRWRG